MKSWAEQVYAQKIPWVQMYGIWSEERGWWFADYTIFYTEHYSVALAQRDMLQQHYPSYLDDGSIIHYEVRPLPSDESEEANGTAGNPEEDTPHHALDTD